MLISAFTAAQVTAIAANTGLVTSQQIPCQGAKGYRVINMTAAPMSLLDEAGHQIDVLPPQTEIAWRLREPTRFLQVQFNNAQATQTTPYTSNPSWQVWIEALEFAPRLVIGGNV